MNDLKGKAVLITGGTKGIGLATGLAFGAQGAAVILTHKWGSADENAIRAQFAAVGAPEPLIMEADARESADTDALLERIGEQHQAIEVFVSGVAFAQIVNSLNEFSKRSFMQSMEYTVWPTIEYLQKIKAAFKRYPRYVVTLSSEGADTMHYRYDIAATCKSAIETVCRYLSHRLVADNVRVNIVRSRYTDTESFAATMGAECAPFIKTYDPKLLIPAEDTAKVVLALTSGMMDGVSGQIIMVDGGTGFSDNLMGLFTRCGNNLQATKGKNKHDT